MNPITFDREHVPVINEDLQEVMTEQEVPYNKQVEINQETRSELNEIQLVVDKSEDIVYQMQGYRIVLFNTIAEKKYEEYRSQKQLKRLNCECDYLEGEILALEDEVASLKQQLEQANKKIKTE